MKTCPYFLMFDQAQVKCTHPNSESRWCKFDISWLVNVPCPLNRKDWKDEETL